MVSRLDDLNQVTKSLESFICLTPEVERATPALPLAHRLPSSLLGFLCANKGTRLIDVQLVFLPQ